jgi:hypothetical protein
VGLALRQLLWARGQDLRKGGHCKQGPHRHYRAAARRSFQQAQAQTFRAYSRPGLQLGMLGRMTQIDRPERLAQLSGQHLARAHAQRRFPDTAGACHVWHGCPLLLQQTKHFSGAIFEPNGFDHLWLHFCQRNSPTGTCAVKGAPSETPETPCSGVRALLVRSWQPPIAELLSCSFAHFRD